MPIHIPINILDFIFKGMMIGMIASAPMGPVGILCVQRTLNKGRWYGMATGVGAAVSDILYAGFAGFGMSFVMDLINNDENRFYLQMGGSIMLLCFGLYTYKSDPTKKMHKSGQQKGTLWYNTWTAFLVTFSNPLIIFLFLALYDYASLWYHRISVVALFLGEVFQREICNTKNRCGVLALSDEGVNE